MSARLAALALLALGLFAWQRALARAGPASGGAPPLERLVSADHPDGLSVAGISVASLARARPLLYAQRGGVWRCETAFGALALRHEIDLVVADLVLAVGELYSADPARQAAYGFDAPGAFTVALHGPRMFEEPGSDVLFSLDIGRALPGPDRGRCFVRRSGTNAIYEIQRNPRPLFERSEGWDLPPFLDRRVLAGEWPGPGEGVLRAFVDFHDGRALELRIRRVPEEEAVPDSGPTEWVVVESGRPTRCLPFRVVGWQAFLFRVPYVGIADPADAPRLGFADGPRVRLTLFLTGGVSPIELGLGEVAPDGRNYVSNSKTGMLCAVDPAYAPLFAPTLESLSSTDMKNPWEAWLRR